MRRNRIIDYVDIAISLILLGGVIYVLAHVAKAAAAGVFP